MRSFVGTSGYSYKEWKGRFYPEGLAAAKMLAFYATRFPTVEINNTFYRMPTGKMLAAWTAEVPEGFTFAIKAPRQITHILRLKDAADAVAALARATSSLQSRQGPILFQLPPFMKKDVPRLAEFLGALPAGVQAAFEFRHPSWFEDDVYAALRTHGAALCISDSEKISAPLVATAAWGYLRLRRADYTPADVEVWADKIRAQHWSTNYVFFKHEDEAQGPELAADLITKLGGPSARRDG